MKQQRNSVDEDVKDILAIIVGQFLVVALKGDAKALAEYRKGYVAHFAKLHGADLNADLISETVTAGRAFTRIMGSRYGWDDHAVARLSSCVEDVCRAWVSELDIAEAIGRLRVVDAWSGIAACTAKNASMPLSLLDYVLMTLLPVVCSAEILVAAKAVWGLSDFTVEALEVIDAALEACVSRLCCGIGLKVDLRNELKLAILLHFPKDEGRLSANAGFAYKMLQRQYANMEVK